MTQLSAVHMTGLMTLEEARVEVERLIWGFLEGRRTAKELSVALRDCALSPDIGLRAFVAVNIDWKQVGMERMLAVAEVIGEITSPVLESFFAGLISADEAAVQVAPFFLMWRGFGLDAAADDDPNGRIRAEELERKIAELYERVAPDR